MPRHTALTILAGLNKEGQTAAKAKKDQEEFFKKLSDQSIRNQLYPDQSGRGQGPQRLQGSQSSQ